MELNTAIADEHTVDLSQVNVELNIRRVHKKNACVGAPLYADLATTSSLFIIFCLILQQAPHTAESL